MLSEYLLASVQDCTSMSIKHLVIKRIVHLVISVQTFIKFAKDLLKNILS